MMPSVCRVHTTKAIVAFAMLIIGFDARADVLTRQAPFWQNMKSRTSFEKAMQHEISAAQKALDQALAVKGKRTVENTLAPYDEMYQHLWAASAQALLIAETHPDPSFREGGRRIRQHAEQFEYALSSNRKAYEAVRTVDLTPADAKTRYYAAKLIRDWQRSGIEKDDTTRKEILSLQNQLTKAGQEFSRNINEDSRVIKVNKS